MNDEVNRSDADTDISEPPVVEPALEYDLEKAAAFKAGLEAQQNLPMAIAGGLGAALVGGALWATVTVVTHYQIGWMAVGVGFLVGIVVRSLGKGLTKPFGIVGGACALLGCALGNVFSVMGFLSYEESIPLTQVVISVLNQPAAFGQLLFATMSPMDFLFYAIAVYEGYKFSFREITADELSSLMKPVEQPSAA